MIKIFDFLYYFFYQLNRRGYKSGNYDSARFALSFIFFVFINFSLKIIEPIIHFYFKKNISYNFWAFFSIFSSIAAIYYFTNKFYSENGSRKWVVAHYDKNSKIKKQNSVIQVFLLTFLIFAYFLFCYIMGIRLQRFLGIYVPE